MGNTFTSKAFLNTFFQLTQLKKKKREKRKTFLNEMQKDDCTILVKGKALAKIGL